MHALAFALAAAGLLLSGSPAAGAQGVLGPHLLLLKNSARRAPGYLGVSLQQVESAKKSGRRVVIISVDRDGPAAAAGLRTGDTLLAVHGKQVASLEEVRHELKGQPAGTRVELRVAHEGAGERTILVELGDEEQIASAAAQRMGVALPVPMAEDGCNAPGPAAGATAGAPPPPPGSSGVAGGGSHLLGIFTSSATYTGLDLDALSTQLAEYFGVQDGAGLLVRTVSSNSPAAAAGVRAGDVILRANAQPVVSRMDWIKQLHASHGRPLQLLIMRNHREQTVTLQPGPGGKG